MAEIATLTVGLVIETAKAFGQVEKGLGKMAKAAAPIGIAIASAIGVGTAALVAFAGKSVSVAKSFESQMAIMKTAIDPLGPSLDEMHEAMLRVGADNELIGITASEAAEATTNFYKAGLTTNDIMGDYNGYMEGAVGLTGALRAAIDLAAASDLELAETSELVAVSMAQYGLDASEATRITNGFVKAADASQAEVSDLGVAMSYVGPTAAAMGISFEDTTVALAMMSEGGLQGSAAGTGLNRVLNDLLKTSPKAKKAMAALGISMYDADGAMKPLPDVLSMLNEKLGDAAIASGELTEQEREEYKAAIFTTQGRRAVNVLLASGTQGWSEMSDKIGQAATAEEVAAARSATFEGTMEKLGGTVETLLIKVGDTLLPLLGDLGDKFNEFITTYTPGIVAGFETFAGIVDRIRIAFNIFTASMGTGQTTFEALGNVLTYLLPEDVATKIMDFLSGLGEKFETVKEVIASVVDTIVGAIWPQLQGVFDELTGVLDGFGLTWGDVWDAVKQATQIVMGIVGGIILGLVGIVLGVVAGVLGGLRRMIAGWRRLRAGVEKVLTGIAMQVGGWIDVIKGFIEGDMDKVAAGFAKIWEGMQTIVGGILDTIQGFFEATFGSIIETAKVFVDTVVGFFSDLYQRLVGGSIVPELMAGILGFFESLPGKLLDALGGLAEGVGDLLRGLFGPLLDFDPALVGEMFALLAEGLIGLGELWTAFMTKLNETWTLFSVYLLEVSWPLLTETWTLMLALWQSVWQSAMLFLANAFRELVEIILEGIAIMIEAWQRLRAEIDAVAAAVARVTAAMKKMTSDEMIARLKKLGKWINDLHRYWDKVANAAEQAYRWQQKAAGGGGSRVGEVRAEGAQHGIWSVESPIVRRLHAGEMVLPARPASIARTAAGGFSELARLLAGGVGGVQIGPITVADDYDFIAKVERVLIEKLGVT